ncbi:hypothetical protein NEMBOFW57_010589 [Staphylotrichum longicolle]|uniref:Heterokaryon incompatibility domain-containing protein n=1 Tax=Staphylotrichum longicolle TaxID=669026 RepID=A0AAD4END6_9PEZI|nr:hypothetical protein NEMBOFW57_010589 [Staphylotrichum longicolle]
MATPPPFTYTPITPSEFRLLKIHAVHPQVRFTLEPFSIDDYPGYQALSYAWGTSLEAEPALCNGAAFSISRTLGAAMRGIFAHAKSSAWVWIDAICINQTDNVEKAHQVAGMGDVYSCADRVLVWLGEAADDSDLACDLLPELNDRVWAVREKVGAWRALSEEEVASLGLVPADDPLWKAVLLLYSRPWFQRLWIVQEIVLARECLFLCGKKKVEWNVLYNFAQATTQSVFVSNIAGLHTEAMGSELMTRGTNGIRLMTNTWKMQEGMDDPEREASGISGTMSIMQSQGAAVKVDYVYAVRGMLPEALREKVIVDYSDEVKQNYGAVHAKFFRQCLAMIKDWPSLYFTANPHPSGLGIPSWCPHWGTGWNTAYLPVVRCSAGRPSATSYLPSFNKLSLTVSKEEDEILGISGIALDTIHEVFQLREAFNDEKGDLPPGRIKKVLSHCIAHAPVGADGPERLMGVLIGEIGFADTKFFTARPEGPLLDSLFAYLESIARRLEKHESISTAVEDVFGQFRFWRSYFNLAINRWPNRAFAVTTNGRIALVPSHSKVGDAVCLFLGATHPQVLSRHDDGKHWTYVGPTVVDGLMKGEYFESTKDWMSRKETFGLK